MTTTTSPYWTRQEQAALVKLVSEGTPLSDVAMRFRRSEDAVKMKLKRIGVAPPEKSVAEKTGVKVTVKATTTTPKLKPVKFEELPSPNEAMGFLWAAVKRLQQSNVSHEEVKKLRLIISAVKAYIHLEVDYVVRMRQVERHMLVMCKAQVVHLKALADRAKNPEKKAQLETQIEELQGHVADFIAMGVTEPKKPKKKAPW